MRTRNCNKVTQSFKDVKNLIKSKKARDEQGLFVTEGIKIFSETPMDRVEAVFATAEFAREHPEMIARIPAGTERVLDVRADRFAGISDTKSPQGIIAVVRKKKYTHATPFTKESLLYREIFEKYYPEQSQMVADFWMPNKNWNGCDVNDPSARVLSNYGMSGE